MKFSSVVVVFLGLASSSHAFVKLGPGVHPIAPSFTTTLHAVELEPEPEGGKELTAITSMPGCRIKEMEQLSSVKSDLGTPYQFWMTAEVDAALIKEIRTQILKDASKKAKFPGFRKVCV